ncbi:uncharacterized protein [Porites lutea]|uniref:uncharacterized protein n=1 Tax=Porites lutea TaxID=51062 RepID=UPI003CC55D99
MKMFSYYCHGLGYLFRLITMSIFRAFNRVLRLDKSEGVYQDCEGNDTTETLTEAVQCTDDQERSDHMDQVRLYSRRKLLVGPTKEPDKNNLCREVKVAVKIDVEATSF